MSLTRWAIALLATLGLVAAAPSPGYGVTLDREGTGGPPDYYACHPYVGFQKAGGKPKYAIDLYGWCGVHSGGGSGWDWMKVPIVGSYNYDTGVAEETIWAGQKVVLSSFTQCPKNPWIWGEPCQVVGLIINKTGVMVPGPFPKSAWMIPGNLRADLQKLEASPKDELAGWQPYSDSPPAPSGLAVVKPTPGESISPAASSFNLELKTPFDPSPSVIIELEWAKIGYPPDPKLETEGAWTYNTPAGVPKSAAWGKFPLPIPVANVFASGLYAVRAKFKTNLDLDWTDWRKFWIGKPDPGLAQYAKEPAQGQQGQFGFSKIKEVLLIGKGGQKLVEVSQAAKLLAKQGVPAQKAGLPRTEGQAEAARDLDALTKRLAPLQQNPEGQLLLREAQALQRELAAGPDPREADRLRRDAQRLGREVDRLDADLQRRQQRAAAGTPATPEAGPSAPGPQPGQPSGPPQVAAIPGVPARDPVAEQAAKELETLARRLTALGANPEAQRLIREVQLLQRQLGSDPGQAPAILRDAKQLASQVDRLEASLRQPTTAPRTAPRKVQ